MHRKEGLSRVLSHRRSNDEAKDTRLAPHPHAASRYTSSAPTITATNQPPTHSRAGRSGLSTFNLHLSTAGRRPAAGGRPLQQLANLLVRGAQPLREGQYDITVKSAAEFRLRLLNRIE